MKKGNYKQPTRTIKKWIDIPCKGKISIKIGMRLQTANVNISYKLYYTCMNNTPRSGYERYNRNQRKKQH